MGRYWQTYFPRVGEAVLVTAGGSPVWIGGARYNAVTLGWSDPYELAPGQSAYVELTDDGSATTFAVFRVTPVEVTE